MGASGVEILEVAAGLSVDGFDRFQAAQAWDLAG
jgi:hypothetical protein